MQKKKDDKVLRVASALWEGFGGNREHFLKFNRTSDSVKQYRKAAKEVIKVADSNEEDFEEKIAFAANAVAEAWGYGDGYFKRRPVAAGDTWHRATRLALEEEAKDTEEV